MDAVYGTKRYLRSLMGNNSDIYGSPNSRIRHNEINNSYGYRSAINTEMSKYPYFNDLSQPNQYGYNHWGVWREQSLAPSVYSAKSRQEVKSFSIILSTAAFIVILAVISVAGLAFYFGTFKSNLDEPVMMFEGNFHIMKGDVYTTALKYNHSSTYKQKVDFYERFIEKSLRDNDLQPVKIEILGFGDGPLINTIFRTFLDIRRIPANIRSVEEHIKEAILYQTNSPKSLYKSIRVDTETISVKRVLDDEKIKAALFVMANSQEDTMNYYKKMKPNLIKSSSPTLITTSRAKISKTTPNNVLEDSSYIDTDEDAIPAVVSKSFEGSFEITKTDADITRKKTMPTKSVASKKSSQTTARLKSKTKPTVEKVYKSPINTTLSMFVKPASAINDGLKPALPTSTSVTRVATQVPKTLNKSTKIITTLKTRIVPSVTTRKITTKITTAKTTTTTEAPLEFIQHYNSTATPYHSSSIEIATLNEENLKELNRTMKESEADIAKNEEGFTPAKLDVHLFTTSPVLDTEPWRPIRPPIPTTPPFNVGLSSALPNLNAAELKKDFTEHLKNIKNRTATATTKDSDLIFYHSFTNPVFMPGLSGIEKLGNSVVKPHPIPVQLLDEIVAPDFKIIRHDENVFNKLLLTNSENKDNLFEEIGGGVMLRRANISDKNKISESNTNISDKDKISEWNTSITTTTTTTSSLENEKVESSDEIPTKNEIILTKNINSSQKLFVKEKPEEIYLHKEKLNSMKKNSSGTELIDMTDKMKENDTAGIFNDIEGRNKQSTIVAGETAYQVKENHKTEILNSSLLFPTLTKWEYKNSTMEENPNTSSIKKIFNETLHAWVVRDGVDEEKKNISDLALKTNITSVNHPKVNIQDISLIFDTLASKLGISTGTHSRKPPFPVSRLKQSSRIDYKMPTTTTTSTTETTPTTSIAPTSTTLIPQILEQNNNKNNDDRFVPIIPSTKYVDKIEPKEILNDASLEKIEGEAEIEIIDPNIYDEILKYSQALTSSTPSTLRTVMTLLPVKSNSGIRPLHSTHHAPTTDDDDKPFMNTNFREATVKDQISVSN